MTHINNIQVVKASTLVEGIDLSPTKKYNLIEVFVNLEDLDNSRDKFQIAPILDSVSAQQFGLDIIDDNGALNKLYTPYVGSKSIQIVRRNKNMILTMNKLEEVYIDL